MPSRPLINAEKEAQILKELGRAAMQRQQGYREQALKLLPHICASCCREFAGKRLRELTVHHKDHNWKNNPPDGSNWVLLCLFCHDHEHEKYKLADYHGGALAQEKEPGPSIFSPFANLDQLVKPAADDTAADDTPPAEPVPGPDAAGGESEPEGK